MTNPTLARTPLTMPSWDAITYGAALSAILAALLALAAPEHPPAILVAIATGAFAEPVA
jgi:hypothetical protein